MSCPWSSPSLKPSNFQTESSEAEVRQSHTASLQEIMDEALALKLYEEECRQLSEDTADSELITDEKIMSYVPTCDIQIQDEFEETHDNNKQTSSLLLTGENKNLKSNPFVRKSTKGTSGSNKRISKKPLLIMDDDYESKYTPNVNYHQQGQKSVRNHSAGELSDYSTSEGVLDHRTQRIIQQLINNKIFDALHGCIQTGKEAHVFYAVDEHSRALAVKIFKKTLNQFRNRHVYVEGDARYDLGYQKKSIQRQIQCWAEKEFANLSRAFKYRNSALQVPQPIHFKENIVAMEFLGSDEGWRAPTLKDISLASTQLLRAYAQLILALRVLYQDARLVHGDLSEYNVLYHKKKCWIIDFGQSVDLSHPAHMTLLERDIKTITSFFERRGLPQNSLDVNTNSNSSLVPLTLALEIIVSEVPPIGKLRSCTSTSFFELLTEKQKSGILRLKRDI